MSCGLSLELGDWGRLEALAAPLRRRVFIEEQGVPEDLEWDEADAAALHALARLSDGTPVGTARMLANGQIGRMAVRADWRRRGIGAVLLQALLKAAAERGQDTVWLNAQLQAQPFYRHHGFHAIGPIFDDAGIPHRRMSRRIG